LIIILNKLSHTNNNLKSVEVLIDANIRNLYVLMFEFD